MTRCNYVGCSDKPEWIVKYVVNNIKVKTFLCSIHLTALKAQIVDDVQAYEMKPETTKIDRSFEQVECLNCHSPMLLPELYFSLDDDRVKRKSIFCIICHTPYIIEIEKFGDPKLIMQGEIKKYDMVPTAMGCRASTGVYYRLINDQIETRCGIMIMGTVNFPTMIDACPFDPNYLDNYIQGFGATLEESLQKLLAEAIKMSKGLLG